VKRRDLVARLERHGCRLFREGAAHTVDVNGDRTKTTTIPRHREVHEFLARKICRDLDVPVPLRG